MSVCDELQLRLTSMRNCLTKADSMVRDLQATVDHLKNLAKDGKPLRVTFHASHLDNSMDLDPTMIIPELEKQLKEATEDLACLMADWSCILNMPKGKYE